MRTTVVTLALLALAACGSRATDPGPGSGAPSPTTSREPWFCQVAQTGGEWDCIQSETLAQNPRPDRLPEAATRAPVIEPSAVPDPAAEPVPPAAWRDEPPAAAVTEEPALAQSDLPRYQQLAYQPDRPVSLLDLPPTFWAAQLIAVSTKEALEEYAEEHQLRGMSAARVAVADNLFYVLLLGIYETREIAEQAIADLPPPFDVDKPWLRPLGSLQEAMLRGDELAGTSSI